MGTATHSSILVWRIPWTVVHGGHKELDTSEQLSLHFIHLYPGHWLFTLAHLCPSCSASHCFLGSCFFLLGSRSFFFSLFLKKYLFFRLHEVCTSCGMQTLSCGLWDLVLWPGIEPRNPALGAWSLSHRTTREVPRSFFLRCFWKFSQQGFLSGKYLEPLFEMSLFHCLLS